MPENGDVREGVGDAARTNLFGNFQLDQVARNDEGVVERVRGAASFVAVEKVLEFPGRLEVVGLLELHPVTIHRYVYILYIYVNICICACV